MGQSETSLKTMMMPLNNFVVEVLGSFDCTCKSRCCENYKILNFYYHCRTTENNRTESDDELVCESPNRLNL